MIQSQSILDLIGNTPLVEARHIISKKDVRLFLKMEGKNPGGSVKDRPAYNMINEALKRGDIKKGDTLVEATSGNTGIALAFIAQLLGLKMILIMPENSTVERVKTMRAYGAEVILTNSENGIEDSRDLAFELRDTKGYTLLNQFRNLERYKWRYNTFCFGYGNNRNYYRSINLFKREKQRYFNHWSTAKRWS
jgi:cysteine synthase B